MHDYNLSSGMITPLQKSHDYDFNSGMLFEHAKAVDYNLASGMQTPVWIARPDYLYNRGDMVHEYTGGWQSIYNVITHTGAWAEKNCSLPLFEKDKITFKTDGVVQYRGTSVMTVGKVDFSNINKLIVRWNFQNVVPSAYRYIITAVVTGINGTIVAHNIHQLNNAKGILDVELNTASLQAEYSVYAGVFTSDGYYFEAEIQTIKTE